MPPYSFLSYSEFLRDWDLSAAGLDTLLGPTGDTSASAVYWTLIDQPADFAFMDELGWHLAAAKKSGNSLESTEGAKFWMKVFNDLLTRGVTDTLIAVTDGLKGMREALAAIYPATTLQTCGHQREPRPITWAEQRELIPRLPDHLARMVLCELNSGVRDEVVCGLKWEWEIAVPELGVSVFDIPRESVKGRKRSRVLVCNTVAQSIIESVRGMHCEFVFVWTRGVKKVYVGGPVETMNNTAWQRARRA